jgi:hypothetical protein
VPAFVDNLEIGFMAADNADQNVCLVLFPEVSTETALPIPDCFHILTSFVLHAHGIHAEEGLHRPVGSHEFVPALMVSAEDYPRASALADCIAPMLNVMAY